MGKLIDTLLGWGIQNTRAAKVKPKAGLSIVFASVYLTEDERKHLGELEISSDDVVQAIRYWLDNGFNVRITPKSQQGFEGVSITHTTFTYKGKSVSIQGEAKVFEKAILACFYKMAVIKQDRGMDLSEGVDSSDFEMR